MTRNALNRKIEKLCERRGMQFKPWEITPWWVGDGPSPYPPGCGGNTTWAPAQRLRRALIAEIAAEIAAKKAKP